MTTTYVCSYKDIECGSKPENWCSKCPLKLRTNEPKGAAIPESQKAFETHYSGYHNITNEDFSKTDGLYNLSYLHRDYEKWQAAEAYGRKQALEKLQAIYHRTYPSTEAQLAAIKELIK